MEQDTSSPLLSTERADPVFTKIKSFMAGPVGLSGVCRLDSRVWQTFFY